MAAHPFGAPQPGNPHRAGTIVADDFDARMSRLEAAIREEQEWNVSLRFGLAVTRLMQGCSHAER